MFKSTIYLLISLASLATAQVSAPAPSPNPNYKGNGQFFIDDKGNLALNLFGYHVALGVGGVPGVSVQVGKQGGGTAGAAAAAAATMPGSAAAAAVVSGGGSVGGGAPPGIPAGPPAVTPCPPESTTCAPVTTTCQPTGSTTCAPTGATPASAAPPADGSTTASTAAPSAAAPEPTKAPEASERDGNADEPANAGGIMGQVITLLNEASGGNSLPKTSNPLGGVGAGAKGKGGLGGGLYNISLSAIAAVNKYVYTAVAKSTLNMSPVKHKK